MDEPGKIRTRYCRWIHVHFEASPHGGRQDPHAINRTILSHYSAATRRKGSRRRTEIRRNGSLGTCLDTAPLTHFAKFSPLSPTISRVVQRLSILLSKAKRSRQPNAPASFNVLIEQLARTRARCRIQKDDQSDRTKE